MPTDHVPVLVVGGGPVGLAAACELGWRGVPCRLIEQNPATNRHPRANVVGARTMEHLRRWGIADRAIAVALHGDYPIEYIFATRVCGGEFFRFSFPTFNRALDPTERVLREFPSVAQSPYFKTSIGQNHFEPVLLEFAGKLPDVDVRFGWRLAEFEQEEGGVAATVENAETGARESLSADFLVACDGAKSIVRRKLGIELQGQGQLGRFLGIYFRAPDFHRLHGSGPSSLHWAMNAESSGCFIAIDGKEHFTFQLALRPGQDATNIDPRAAIAAAFGRPLHCEIVSVQPWTAHQLVAGSYGADRIFLAGDAAHLFVPTGGFGMNTGISDAVDIGWKLAALYAGWGGPGLPASYEAERRPIGIRKSIEAADNYTEILPALRLGGEAEEPGEEGRKIREEIALRLEAGRKHFAAAGIHLGYRYEGSPVCIPDGTPATEDDPQFYRPTSRPGSRAPHAWLSPGRSTLDLFGRGFVLLGFGRDAGACAAMAEAAAGARIPLSIETIADTGIADLYETRFVLVRPDGHVAWRGDAIPPDPSRILATVTGHSAP